MDERVTITVAVTGADGRNLYTFTREVSLQEVVEAGREGVGLFEVLEACKG